MRIVIFRESQDFGGTELNAKTAPFTPVPIDVDYPAELAGPGSTRYCFWFCARDVHTVLPTDQLRTKRLRATKWPIVAPAFRLSVTRAELFKFSTVQRLSEPKHPLFRLTPSQADTLLLLKRILLTESHPATPVGL